MRGDHWRLGEPPKKRDQIRIEPDAA